MKTCTKCDEQKPHADFYRQGAGRHCWCKVCMRAYCQAKHDPRATKDRTLLRRYGISLAVYESMVEQRNGRCEICTRRPKDALVVDHDHETDGVRGLLCRQCNAMLGLACENPQTFLAAIRYLGTV